MITYADTEHVDSGLVKSFTNLFEVSMMANLNKNKPKR
jgi:hypothetical protein